MTKIEMIITVRFGDGIGVVSGVTMPNYVHIGSARLRLGNALLTRIFTGRGRAQARGLLAFNPLFNAAALPVARR